MSAIGTSTRRRTLRSSSSAPATVIPFSSARWFALWTVGPSAIGSEKGIEISKPSAPASAIAASSSTDAASSRWPAMIHGSRASRPSAARRSNSSANVLGFAGALGKADRLLDARQHRVGDRPRALGAARHQRVELLRLGEQLLVASLERRERFDDQLAQVALEVAVPLALVARLDRGRRLAAQELVDRQQVEDAGTARVEADLAL